MADRKDKSNNGRMSNGPATYIIKLSDGNEYRISELNCNMMEAVEEEFDKSWTELMTNPRTKVAKALFYAMVKPFHPELTRDQIGELLTPKAMREFQEILSKQGRYGK